MSARLLLDEHYAVTIATQLRARDHDVLAALEHDDLRGHPDAELFDWAAGERRRIVTENIKDYRPLLVRTYTLTAPGASLLLVSPRRFPRGKDRTSAIVTALATWLSQPNVDARPDEDWLD